MTTVNVVDGDITQVEADALITAINSGGTWWDGIDGTIELSYGLMFHEQAAQAMPLHDGQIVYAPAYAGNCGKFNAVLFVVDELQQPLYNLVAAALYEVEGLALTSVSIPTIRTGVTCDKYEPRDWALDALAIAIGHFEKRETCVKTINIVVPHNEDDRIHLLDVLENEHD